MSKYFIYMIECKNGSYYTGYTTDVARRYQSHVDHTGKCKYTRAFPPKRLAASWEVGDDLSLALKIEHAIKQLPRAKKERLILEKKLSLDTSLFNKSSHVLSA